MFPRRHLLLPPAHATTADRQVHGARKVHDAETAEPGFFCAASATPSTATRAGAEPEASTLGYRWAVRQIGLSLAENMSFRPP
jgi:hypothetical protein